VHTVKATVISKCGVCPYHEVGDQIIFDGRTLQGQFCASALVAMMPTIYALHHGAQFHWMKDGNTTRFACPDGNNPVIFELERVEEAE